MPVFNYLAVLIIQSIKECQQQFGVKKRKKQNRIKAFTGVSKVRDYEILAKTYLSREPKYENTLQPKRACSYSTEKYKNVLL